MGLLDRVVNVQCPVCMPSRRIFNKRPQNILSTPIAHRFTKKMFGPEAILTVRYWFLSGSKDLNKF